MFFIKLRLNKFYSKEVQTARILKGLELVFPEANLHALYFYKLYYLGSGISLFLYFFSKTQIW